MKETFTVKTTVVWQVDKENGISEDAIAVSRYVGSVALTQAGRSINIIDDSVEEVIKAIRLMQKAKPKD